MVDGDDDDEDDDDGDDDVDDVDDDVDKSTFLERHVSSWTAARPF